MAIGYIIGAMPMIIEVSDYPDEEYVKDGVTFDYDNREGTFLPTFAGQDIIGTLEESVDMTGEIDTS